MQDDVKTWLRQRTSHWRDWPPERLLAAKRAAGTQISVVIPARNEERTVGRVVGALRQALLTATPLVDEIVVVDSDSTDGTARAAERVTPDEAAELEDIVREMRVAVEAAELLRYSDANARLHARIRVIAAHDTATSIIERLRAQLVRHQFALALIPGRPAVSLAQHEQIVAAVVARDPVAAEAAMRDHITSVIEALSSLAGQQAGPGTSPRSMAR